MKAIATQEARRVGSESVVGQLGTLDGLNADPEVRIPPPPSPGRIRATPGGVGCPAGSMTWR